MEQIDITAAGASVSLHPERGALVSSLKLLDKTGSPQELLWQPPDQSNLLRQQTAWPNCGIPILFPFAGRVWHNGKLGFYQLNGKTYPMDLHGFAYARRWRTIDIKTSAVQLELISSGTDTIKYPFEFKIALTLTLTPRALAYQLKIYNLGKQENSQMPVAAGLHPFFKMPEMGELKHNAKTYFEVAAGAAGKKHKVDHHKPLACTDPRLQSGIFGDLSATQASIIDKANNQEIKLSWSQESPINYLVVWSNQSEGYFCLEPWMGLPDAVHNQSGLCLVPAGGCVTINLEIFTLAPGKIAGT